MCYQLQLEPRDVLFFRDARPMDGSFIGGGAHWPLPSVWHSSVMSALYDKWPEGHQPWEKPHRHERKKHDRKFGYSRMRFGGLKTWGPFPSLGNEVHFPAPLDLTEQGDLMRPQALPDGAVGNAPLPQLVVRDGKPSKEKPGEWISADQLTAYLHGKEEKTENGRRKTEDGRWKTESSEKFFVSEQRPGVGIDAETHANKEGLFYAAEYLRMKEEAEMTAFAECFSVGPDGQTHDVLGKLLDGKDRLPLIFGGQRGLAWLSAKRNDPPFSRDIGHISGTRIKWVLLSPSVFQAGWHPGWVKKEEDWAVQLKNRPERRDGESRIEWRKRLEAEPAVGGKLVAACLGKPRPFSGWRLLTEDGKRKTEDHLTENGKGKTEDHLTENGKGKTEDMVTEDGRGKTEEEEQKTGPAWTWLAVPAGSVYYFDCDDEEQARNLAAQLHGQTKSDMLGEQGFGLGVCGTW